MLKKHTVEGYAREYTYDPRGLLTSVKESGKGISLIERTYDESGRLTQEAISLNGTLQQDTRQTWTPSSRSLKIGDHKRDFHYLAGRLRQIDSNGLTLSYDYAVSGSLTKKTTPFSALEIRYNDSALPIAVDVIIGNNAYKETLEWTQSGKLASLRSSYPQAQADTFTYSSRG